jgi:SdpC family antimicrobial peptide
MQQQRFPRLTVLAGAVTAVLVTSVIACGNNDRAALAGARTALSGEEVFRGLVFREGAVAAVFTETGGSLPPRKLTLGQREARERESEQLMADIRKADPTFFDRFGSDLQSGDHLRIEQALRESAVLVKQAIRKRNPAAPMPGGLHGMCTDNTTSDNTSADNTSSGNTEYGNTEVGNTSIGNTEVGNTSSGNVDFDNTSADNVDNYNTIYNNTYFDNITFDNTTFDNTTLNGENSWTGTQLGRDQLVELIAERLATK